MNIQQLIQMLESKITFSRWMIERANESWQIETIVSLEADIAQCEETLNKLKTLV